MQINKKRTLSLLILSLLILMLMGTLSATDTINKTTKSGQKEQTTTIPSEIIKKTENTQKSEIYVNSNANGNNNGTSKEYPTTISEAIKNAENGQTIHLTTNNTTDTYKFTSALSISKDINIIGENNKTIILDGQGKYNIFNIYRSKVTLQNIQIINSKTSTAPITATNSELTLNNTIFKNNHGTNSGSVLSKESELKIINSTFTNNTSEKIGGTITQLANKTLTITESTFTDNTAEYDGGSIYSIQSNVNINSSTFTNNTARNGGALYLGNNVNNIQLKITNSIFADNNANNEADSIWTNYHITINNNVFVSTNNNNWIRTDKNCNNNLNSNWWSRNSPNFQTITNGFVPENWRLMKVTNKTSNGTNQITVSINSLSDSTTTEYMPPRQVKYSADNGTFTQNTQTITSNVTNNYNGNSQNIKIIIDNQQMSTSTLIEPYLSINNITTTKGGKVTFNINANKEITSQLTLKINNITLTPLLENGKTRYNYTIPTSWQPDNYTTTLTYNGNSIYNKKTINGYLYIKESNIEITPITTKDITPTTQALPVSYDLREHNQVTPVKSQGSSGSCWAFSSLASLESALLKKTGTSYDLSENNMKNVLKKYSIIGDSVSDPNTGFNDLEPIGYLVGWYGPVNENQDTYQASSYVSPLISPYIHIQDVYIIPNRNSFTDNELIKQAIYQYGAVSTGIYKPTSTNAYSTGREIDHSVTIIGWDDNYSKNNFNPNPPGDGAFIIKNSWGNTTGDKGYHYISYYDESIASVGVTSLVNEQLNYVVLLENNDNYTNIYQYDIAVNTLDESSLTDYIAYRNVFNTTRDENIAAIGSYFLQESNYTISIYSENKKIYTQSGYIELPGYRTIRLNKFITLPENQEFMVELTIKGKDEKPVIVEYSDLYYSSIHAQTSFLSFDGQNWEDLYEYECVAPIKVYTKDTPLISSNATEKNKIITVTTTISDVKQVGYLTYYLDNEIVTVNTKTLNNTINNNTIITVTFNDTTNNSKINLEIVYTSENYQIKQNMSLTNIEENVPKKAKLYFYEVQEAESQTLLVSGKLLGDGKAINNSYIKLTVNNETTTIKVGSTGYFSYKAKSTTGLNNITATYDGNKVYAPVTINTSFTVKKKTALYLYSIDNTTNEILISGKLLSEGKAITGAKLTLNINSNRINITPGSSGYFSYKTGAAYGKNNVTVTYAGNNEYNQATYNATFNYYTPKKAVLYLYSIDNSTSNVVISGKLLSEGKAISGSKLSLTVNNKTYTITPGSSGYFSYKINADNGINYITVIFNGEGGYTQEKSSTTFNCYAKKATLYFYTIENTTESNTITISGKLLDNGKAINGAKITLNINGETFNITPGSSGYFSYKYKAMGGQNNITATFADERYSTTTVSTTFYAKRNVILYAYTLDEGQVDKTSKISGKLLNSRKNGIKNKTITITIDSVTCNVTTNAEGYFQYDYKATSTGTKNIMITYTGDEEYVDARCYTTLTVN